MDGVKPLYAAVQSSVLSSLRREWQRYGWEESEIEEKISRLSELWNSKLQATGAVTEPGAHLLAAPSAGEDEAEDEKADDGGDGSKRRRKSGDKPGEKRFKTGQRVNAPLSYPAPASASSASLPAQQQSLTAQRPAQPHQPPVQQPALSIPAYVPRSSMILPLSSASSSVTRIPQLDGSHDDRPPAAAAPTAGTDTAAASADSAASSSSASASSSSSSSSSALVAEPSFLPPAASAEWNPLLTDPLSSLDDLESDGEQPAELSRVRDLMLCQYERVSHSKNRWKIVLRDGIMQIKGKDYVFSRATGELLW